MERRWGSAFGIGREFWTRRLRFWIRKSRVWGGKLGFWIGKLGLGLAGKEGFGGKMDDGGLEGFGVND